jgi:hypothetical protein
MLARGEADAALPRQISAEVRDATNAIIAELEAASRAALAAMVGGRRQSEAETFLWVRLARLMGAADEAVDAARGADASGLRRHLGRFDALTSAIWTVQHAVFVQAPLRQAPPAVPSLVVSPDMTGHAEADPPGRRLACLFSLSWRRSPARSGPGTACGGDPAPAPPAELSDQREAARHIWPVNRGRGLGPPGNADFTGASSHAAYDSSRWRRQRSRVATERVISGNLDENDADAVRVLDPHLGQSPGLCHRLPQDPDTSRGQPLMLSPNVPHLEPDHHRVSGRTRSVTRHLQQSRAEEEHHRRISRRTELPENGQAQHVPVETTAPAQVGRPQQNPAAQHLHATILAASTARRCAGAHAVVPARMSPGASEWAGRQGSS